MSDHTVLNFQVPLNAEAEDLDIEFKLALPLHENAGKAKLAKEICALSNHGGGWIILGRNDDGTYPNELPEDLLHANQDSINQIASSYLQPAPHCSVRWAQPRQVTYNIPVVWVSPVGTSPICGLKNGPNSDNGKSLGVRKGVHYIRKAGPTSAPIETPDEWQAVIRRCVMNDKSALLSALTTMIEQPITTPEMLNDSALDADFEHILSKWIEESKKAEYAVDLSNNFLCLGFQLLDCQSTTTDEIRACLRNRPDDVRQDHQFFDVEYKTPFSPIILEVAGNDGFEVYATTKDFDLRFAWRLSEVISGAEVISYWEDTDWIQRSVEDNSNLTWQRGQAFWIRQQIAYLRNFIATVDYIADYFKHDGHVRIRALYSGLRGRCLRTPEIGIPYSQRYEAHQNTKQVDFTVVKAALASETRSAIVADIIQSINKLFQGPTITADSVVYHLNARK